MNRFMVMAFAVALLAGCVHKSENVPAPLAVAGHTRFEVFGMLDEYVGRFSDGQLIETFSGGETALAAHFERLLRAFCTEEGINPTFDKKVGQEGCIMFFSPAIADAIDRHYTNGVLDESVFDGVSDEDLLRYVAGAYLRLGDEKKSVILGANAVQKLHTVGLVLHRLGCSGVKLYCTRDLVPTSVILVFRPSQRVKKRLGIQKEAAVSELAYFKKNILELVEEIPPNQATKPTSTSATPPAMPEARPPSGLGEKLKGKDPAKITELSFSCTDIRDEDLAALKPLTQLQKLDLCATQISDAGLVHLETLTQLKWLSIANPKISDAGLAHLKTLTKLETLSLDGTQISDAGLMYLKTLTQLQYLDLDSTQISDAGLAHLEKLTQLQFLLLEGTKISGAGLEHLKPLTRLQSLWLQGTQVSDAGLVHLEPLTQLKCLNLCGTQISDAGLAHLKTLTQLQRLNLCGTKISDVGLEYLKALTQLQVLDLTVTKIGDAGLEHLKALTQLQELTLTSTRITDTGLKSLKQMTQLQNITLNVTRVTKAGVDRLQKQLPNCNISW